MTKGDYYYGFTFFDLDEQLEISEKIITHLKMNERTSRGSTLYNEEISKQVRSLFDLIIKDVKTKKDLLSFQQCLEQFDSLDAERKAKVIKDMIKSIESNTKEQVTENNRLMCEKEGHIMGKWEIHKWKTVEDTIIDHCFVKDYTVEHKEWVKTCERCGHKEISNNEPEEVRIEREEKERQAEIKRLEKRLEKLKAREN